MISDWTVGSRRAIAAAALFCVLSAAGGRQARAQIFIWWEATPLTAGARVVDQGQGKTLQLECDAAPQPGDPVFAWDVVMRIQNDVPMFGWSLDLRTPYDSVSASDSEYGEQVLSPTGALQGYVPLPSVIDFVASGAGITLMRFSAEYGLSPSATFESSSDGVAWNCFAFRLTRTLGDTDPSSIEIYGETGPFASSDDLGFFDAVIADNDLAEVGEPGYRYDLPVITISAPPGALWSPDQPVPELYPDDAPAPGGPGTGDPGDPSAGGGDGGTTQPGGSGGTSAPGGSGTPGDPGGDTGSNGDGGNTNGVDPNGEFVFQPPLTPFETDDGHPSPSSQTPEPAPEPTQIDNVSVLPIACGANSAVQWALVTMGCVGWRARFRRRRRPGRTARHRDG